MVGLLKRYRELILVTLLLVLPLGVFFARAKKATEPSRFDRLVLTLTGPIERGVAWVASGASHVWGGYIALHGAHERARSLQQENDALRLDKLELQRVRAENDRMRGLLAFAEAEPERRVVGGHVIGVRLDPKGLQLVTIDRGEESGVAAMMPVVVGAGVVGRVHSVSARTADVLLLSDRNSSIAVRVERSRARANVRGTGSPDTCRLEYALRSDDMVEGDLLATSGTDGVFPRGLPVGKIAGLRKTGQGLYQRADVKPAVDVTKVEEVLVLTSSPPEEEEEPIALSAAATAVQAAGAPRPTPGPDAPPAVQPAALAAPVAPAAARVPSAPAARPATSASAGAAPAAAAVPGAKAASGAARPATGAAAKPPAGPAPAAAKPGAAAPKHAAPATAKAAASPAAKAPSPGGARTAAGGAPASPAPKAGASPSSKPGAAGAKATAPAPRKPPAPNAGAKASPKPAAAASKPAAPRAPAAQARTGAEP